MADTTTKADQTSADSQAAGDTQNVAVDYKAEYEKVTDQLKKAEHVIVTLKKEDKANPAESKVDVEALKKELAQEIEQKNEQFRQGVLVDVVEDELNRLTTNEDERKLIKLYYDKSLVKTGYSRAQIAEDLTNARLLANRPLYEKQLNETRAALQSATGKSSGSAASVKIEQATDNPITLSAQERELVTRVAQRRRISFEEALKIFKK